MDLVVGVSHLMIILSSADFIQGLKRGTKTQQVDVEVKVGEAASLQCPLSYSADVLQVMWQKILPEEEVTVATCHLSGHRLNPHFSTKIRLGDTSVRNCSIVVQNVTEQDKGCYRCLYITSSDVANTGRACIRLCELHEPVLNTSRSDSAEELVVSCSATGRPAPVVALHVQQTIWTHSNIVLNSNGTVTVIRTAALHTNRTQKCTCSATSASGSERKHVSRYIPEFEHTAREVPATENNSVLALYIGLSLLFVTLCVVILAAVKWLVMKRQMHSDTEDNIRETVAQGCITPQKQHLKEENETFLRKRTPESWGKTAMLRSDTEDNIREAAAQGCITPQKHLEENDTFLRQRTPASWEKKTAASPLLAQKRTQLSFD